jgi:cytoskeletal protein CcmA (bactofilin family)
MKCRRSKTSRGARLRGSPAPSRVRNRTTAAGERPAAAATADTAPSLLRIDGPAQRAIDHLGTLIVGRHGVVTGNVSATIIIVEGQVDGNLQASQAVRIAAGARIVGDLCAPRVAIAKGAKLRGRITTQRPPTPGTAAELNEGAVAELLAGA